MDILEQKISETFTESGNKIITTQPGGDNAKTASSIYSSEGAEATNIAGVEENMNTGSAVTVTKEEMVTLFKESEEYADSLGQDNQDSQEFKDSQEFEDSFPQDVVGSVLEEAKEYIPEMIDTLIDQMNDPERPPWPREQSDALLANMIPVQEERFLLQMQQRKDVPPEEQTVHTAEIKLEAIYAVDTNIDVTNKSIFPSDRKSSILLEPRVNFNAEDSPPVRLIQNQTQREKQKERERHKKRWRL